jgi:ABC-type methionine transport system permease subunit
VFGLQRSVVVVRKLPWWIDAGLGIAAALLLVFAVVFGVWLAAVYGALLVALSGMQVFYRWRRGERLNFSTMVNLTRAQQFAVGYLLSLPFWAAAVVYQWGHPAVIVAFVLGTVGAATLISLEIRRNGWSRRP